MRNWLLKWQVERDGHVWGHDGTQVIGDDLADLLAAHTGEQRRSDEGAPYTVSTTDPQAAFYFFCDEVYPGDWVQADVVIWETASRDRESSSIVT